jgi:hypothetical protein
MGFMGNYVGNSPKLKLISDSSCLCFTNVGLLSMTRNNLSIDDYASNKHKITS